MIVLGSAIGGPIWVGRQLLQAFRQFDKGPRGRAWRLCGMVDGNFHAVPQGKINRLLGHECPPIISGLDSRHKRLFYWYYTRWPMGKRPGPGTSPRQGTDDSGRLRHRRPHGFRRKTSQGGIRADSHDHQPRMRCANYLGRGSNQPGMFLFLLATIHHGRGVQRD